MNKLVVYFSYTGNTEKIAKMIQKKLDCDILKLNPVVPYSTDYQTVVDEEQNNDSSGKVVEIEKIDRDLSKYDEIILGTPVWWYSIAPVVRTFLKEYDLFGKIVIPFATNAGWLGGTFKEIESLCINSSIKNEMNIVFKSYSDDLVTSEDDLNNWIEML